MLMGAVGVTMGIRVKRVDGCCLRDYGNTSKAGAVGVTLGIRVKRVDGAVGMTMGIRVKCAAEWWRG